MDNEIISVIIPVYNTEKYLSKCIDSILLQSYKALDIILVDDGSTDSSPKICDSYAEKDSRIRVFHQENSGVSVSRCLGLEMSRGSFVAFTDSDDYMDPEMFAKMYRRMKEDRSNLCVCAFIKVSESGAFSASQPLPLPEGLISGREAVYLLGTEKGHQLVPMWNKLYKKEIFADISFPGRMFCEDEMLIHRILYNCGKVSLLNEGLYFYLQRSSSITASLNDLYILDAATAFLARSRFLFEKGLCGPSLLAASGAVNLLYVSDTRPENKEREKELSWAIKAAVTALKEPTPDIRMKIKLFLLPNGKFIYKAMRRFKAAVNNIFS